MIEKGYDYAITICNYLNNLKGYIEKYEIENLLWCIFGLENDTYNTDLITSEYVNKLSTDIASDLGNDFYEDLYSLYNKIKGGM